MRFFYGKQNMRSLGEAQEKCILLTNGLGGYASVTAGYSVNRCDQGILVAAVRAPNERITMVHRTRDVLKTGEKQILLSTQKFAGAAAPEEGYRHLSSFSLEEVPTWRYQVAGIFVNRTLCISHGRNAAVLTYEIENGSEIPCTLQIDPYLKFAPKEEALREKKKFHYDRGVITDGAYTLYLKTNGSLRKIPPQWQRPDYTEDAKEGRPGTG